MLTKIKSWLLGKVLMSKVVGKFVKHASAVVSGLIFGPKLEPILGPALDAMKLTPEQVEVGLIVAMTGLFGAAWNFVEHRWIKK